MRDGHSEYSPEMSKVNEQEVLKKELDAWTERIIRVGDETKSSEEFGKELGKCIEWYRNRLGPRSQASHETIDGRVIVRPDLQPISELIGQHAGLRTLIVNEYLTLWSHSEGAPIINESVYKGFEDEKIGKMRRLLKVAGEERVITQLNEKEQRLALLGFHEDLVQDALRAFIRTRA